MEISIRCGKRTASLAIDGFDSDVKAAYMLKIVSDISPVTNKMATIMEQITAMGIKVLVEEYTHPKDPLGAEWWQYVMLIPEGWHYYVSTSTSSLEVDPDITLYGPDRYPRIRIMAGMFNTISRFWVLPEPDYNNPGTIIHYVYDRKAVGPIIGDQYPKGLPVARALSHKDYHGVLVNTIMPWVKSTYGVEWNDPANSWLENEARPSGVILHHKGDTK